MINKLVLFSLLTIIFSCNSKEKYNGSWFNHNSDFYVECDKAIINNDSIHFSYPYFEFWNSYPLTLKNNTLLFNNSSIKAEVKKDSLIINNKTRLLKDSSGFHLYNFVELKSKIQIELPKLNNNLRVNTNNKNTNNYFIHYGKRHDNSEFSLELNGSYVTNHNIIRFLIENTDYHDFFTNSMLFIHKDSKMEEVEEILFYHQAMNHLKVSFIDDILTKANDSIGIFFEYKSLVKKLPPYIENDEYFIKPLNLPPPPPTFHIYDFDKSNFGIITLKKSQLFYNNEIINEEELKSILKNLIYEDKHIISLYDLKSNYSSFLNLNSLIEIEYEKLRNNESLKIYNKPLEELNIDELNTIKLKIKHRHIWNYSIPHFEHLINNIDSFAVLKEFYD